MSTLFHFLIFVGSWTVVTSSSAAERPWEKDYRLPKNVVPELYNLLLYPNLKESVFSGNVEILLNITSPMDYIVLHSKNLTIPKSILTAESNENENLVKNAFAYPKNEFWVLELTKSVEGKHNLKLDFSGVLTSSMFGLYKSTYKDETTGQNKTLATTQFEATYARQAFVCFDEPNFKAVYNVKIVRPSEGKYIALSNMNQESELTDSPSQGLTTVTFAKSLPMSTYLTCFIVCDFEKLPAKKCDHGFDVAVYARSSQIKKMEYALQTAINAIDFYIDYFSTDYPLPKLDLIAIPDFSAGAMENWGLVTFRETSVFYDTTTTSALNQLIVTETTCHELAHMFFGDIVTMQWWDDLWLNEGFATYMAFKAAVKVQPDWNLDATFIWYYLADALNLDSTLSSHAIVKHVAHPDEISEIFDDISYSKAAAVLRMAESFLGEENFRKGVASYLKTFALKNAETKDLWHHLQKFSSDVNVERAMDTWTRQMGCPVLVVTQDGDTITVTQKRLLINKNATYDPKESTYNYKWDVPVTFITSENKESTLKWLLLEDSSVKIDIGDVKWYKLNSHFKGYYRVAYPLENWKALGKLLLENIEALDVRDRINIIEDAFALAESGYLEYSDCLELMKFLQNEKQYIVMEQGSLRFRALEIKLFNTSIYDDYREYVRSIISPQLGESIWDLSSDGSSFQRIFQGRVTALACKFEVPGCLEKTKKLFTDWLENNGSKPNVEIQTTVYNYGSAQSGETQWNKLWNRFLAESDPQEKTRLRTSLCATKDVNLIKKLLELAKNKNYIRKQDYFGLLFSISTNPIAVPVVWDWMRSNWKYLVDRFTLNDAHLGSTLLNVVKTFATEERLKEVEKFISENPEEGATAASRKSAVESIKNNIAWLNTHLPSLTAWFKNK